MENYKDTIISQYANSPIIDQLIDFWNQDIDPSANIAEFFDFVWNVETAQGFGLDIWGRIVNISRYLYVTESKKYFGFYNPNFSDADQVYTPFNVQPFFNSNNVTPTVAVDDATYRKMILAKAFANISFASCKTINFILQFLLGDNAAFVVDNRNMTIKYVFNITLTPIQYAIIYQSGIIPVPTGVGVNFDTGKTFGFYSAHVPIPGEDWPHPFNVGVYSSPAN